MSRGLDNRNPGNIRRAKVRYKGEVRPSTDPEFKQFETVEWGYRAVFVLLDTVAGMIARWAPPSENRTDLYIRAVAEGAGVAPDERVDTRDRRTMLLLAAAISRVENGVAARMEEVERGWELFVG